jgi:hypothetical protein
VRTILRNGLDRYEVLKADEPLRRGERLVPFASQRGAHDFLISVGGPARRDLHRLADDDFAGEFATVPYEVLPVDLATRITTGRLKIVHVEMPPPRLRSGGAEFEVLDARDRLRRGESPVRVMDEATAIRFARLLATLPREQQRRLVPIAAAGGAGSQREQTRSLSRLLRRGQIRIVRLQTLTRAGGSAPPEPELSAFGVADAISLGVGFIPIVGDAVDIAGAIVGKDLITGEELTPDERIVTAVGTLLGSGKAARAGWKGAKAGVNGIDNVTDALNALRKAYVDEVTGLADKAASMRKSGNTEELIARTLHADRRALGVKYKNMTPAAKRTVIYARNMAKYGDRRGPTIAWLRARGKTWNDIIESASRPGGKDLGL